MFPKRQQFRLAQIESINFTDDNFNVIQMALYFYDTVENNVGKGENAGYQHFLLFPRDVFKNFLLKVVKSRQRVNIFPKQALVLTCLQYMCKSFENCVGKGEIACYFSFFPTLFFYLFRGLSAIFSKFEIVVCKLFYFAIV